MNTPLSELTDFAERVAFHPLDAMLWERLISALLDHETRLEALGARAQAPINQPQPASEADWQGEYCRGVEQIKAAYQGGLADGHKDTEEAVQAAYQQGVKDGQAARESYVEDLEARIERLQRECENWAEHSVKMQECYNSAAARATKLQNELKAEMEFHADCSLRLAKALPEACEYYGALYDTFVAAIADLRARAQAASRAAVDSFD